MDAPTLMGMAIANERMQAERARKASLGER